MRVGVCPPAELEGRVRWVCMPSVLVVAKQAVEQRVGPPRGQVWRRRQPRRCRDRSWRRRPRPPRLDRRGARSCGNSAEDGGPRVDRAAVAAAVIGADAGSVLVLATARVASEAEPPRRCGAGPLRPTFLALLSRSGFASGSDHVRVARWQISPRIAPPPTARSVRAASHSRDRRSSSHSLRCVQRYGLGLGRSAGVL